MKNILTFLILVCSYFCFAQVGIGVNTPLATLHVNGEPTNTSAIDGIIAPKISRTQLVAKSSVYGASQAGTLVYVTDVSGTSNTPTANIKRVGYYSFDGTVWKALEPTAGTVSFTASLGSGDGSATNATIGATAFNTVRLPNVSSNIGGGTWNATNNTYAVPVTGTYLIKSSIRLIDGSTNSPSRNVFQAVHTSNADIPDGIWQTNSGNRWTMLYTRIANFNAGDLLRLYIYSDGAEARLSDASLNISLITVN